MEARSSHRARPLWTILGKKLPQTEVVFFTQVILIYIIIITCIVNLSLGEGNSNLWTCLLSSSLGYLLPNPKPESVKKGPSTPSQDEPDAHRPPQQ